MRIDLHIHTAPRSACSHLGLSELIQRVKQIKLDGICLTEHHVVWDRGDAAKLAEEGEIKLFRGNEFTTKQGDVLVFGFDKDIKELLTIQELREEVKKAAITEIRKEEVRFKKMFDGMQFKPPIAIFALMEQITLYAIDVITPVLKENGVSVPDGRKVYDKIYEALTKE